MAGLFKTGNALMEQALDLARRREFEYAQTKFHDAAVRFAKEGNITNADLAEAYSGLMMLRDTSTNPAALRNFSYFLRERLGGTELRPGPRGISSSDLANQLDLTSREITLMAEVQSGRGDRAGLAMGLQQLASEYRRLGDQVLFLPELFRQQTVPVTSKVPGLMAISYEVLGTATQGSDPLAAAEHFQTAQQYWIQYGDQARARSAAERVGNLSLRAKCWFCGREGSGHGVQFVSMPIDQDVSGLKSTESSPLPSLDQSQRRLFVCSGCNSAIRILADAFATQRALEVEQRLSERIENLERRVLRPSS